MTRASPVVNSATFARDTWYLVRTWYELYVIWRWFRRNNHPAIIFIFHFLHISIVQSHPWRSSQQTSQLWYCRSVIHLQLCMDPPPLMNHHHWCWPLPTSTATIDVDLFQQAHQSHYHDPRCSSHNLGAFWMHREATTPLQHHCNNHTITSTLSCCGRRVIIFAAW